MSSFSSNKNIVISSSLLKDVLYIVNFEASFFFGQTFSVTSQNVFYMCNINFFVMCVKFDSSVFYIVFYSFENDYVVYMFSDTFVLY